MKDLARLAVGLLVMCGIAAVLTGIFFGVGMLLPASMLESSDPSIFARVAPGSLVFVLGLIGSILITFFAYFIGSAILGE